MEALAMLTPHIPSPQKPPKAPILTPRRPSRRCSNSTAIWSADWGHDGGHDRSHLVVTGDGQAFAFNVAQAWSPATGSVSGNNIQMTFSGTAVSGTLRPPGVTIGITAGRWTIVWTNGAVWHRTSGVAHCPSHSAPPAPLSSPSPPTPPLPEGGFLLCEDACTTQFGTDYSNDGECDDGGPESHYATCLLGDDCTDCGIRRRASGCVNDCFYARDGECDDGGPASVTSVCSLGSDCADVSLAAHEPTAAERL